MAAGGALPAIGPSSRRGLFRIVAGAALALASGAAPQAAARQISAAARALPGAAPQESLEMARHFARLFTEYESAYDIYEEARRRVDEIPVPDALYLRPSDDQGDREKLGLINYDCTLENERGRYFSPKAIKELNRQKTSRARLGFGIRPEKPQPESSGARMPRPRDSWPLANATRRTARPRPLRATGSTPKTNCNLPTSGLSDFAWKALQTPAQTVDGLAAKLAMFG